MVKKYFILGALFGLLVDGRADELARVVQQIKPSIVVVGTFMPKRAPRALFRGTGFAVGDGTIIATNAHVIPNELASDRLEKIAVFFKRNKRDEMYFAKVLATDRVHDVALLKIDKGRLPALKIDAAITVNEGDRYAFTGYPIGMVLGLYPATHEGIVSAITPIAIPMIRSRQLDARLVKKLRRPYQVYQMDAIAYPGNSGSPLYHPQTGHVVGIINSVFVKESREKILSHPSGISYAIPAVYLQSLLRNR
jgi:S1-C subfamily serine protease